MQRGSCCKSAENETDAVDFHGYRETRPGTSHDDIETDTPGNEEQAGQVGAQRPRLNRWCMLVARAKRKCIDSVLPKFQRNLITPESIMGNKKNPAIAQVPGKIGQKGVRRSYSKPSCPELVKLQQWVVGTRKNRSSPVSCHSSDRI